MMQAGERSARVLLELAHSEEAIIRCLMQEIGLSRNEAHGAVSAARRQRNEDAWAVHAVADPASPV